MTDHLGQSEARLRDALRLAVVGLEQLVDPDPQKGILTNVKLQGEAQGVSLDLTYDAVVDLIAVLRAELGESDEGIDHLTNRLEARSLGKQFADLRGELLSTYAHIRAVINNCDSTEDVDAIRHQLVGLLPESEEN